MGNSNKGFPENRTMSKIKDTYFIGIFTKFREIRNVILIYELTGDRSSSNSTLIWNTHCTSGSSGRIIRGLQNHHIQIMTFKSLTKAILSSQRTIS